MKKTMEDSSKIMRRSIHTFLQNYHHATTAAAIALPFSAALLLSQAFFSSSSSSSSSLHLRLNTLFHGAGFTSSLDFFNMLSLKLSQTLSSSLLTLLFSLTFLLLSKAYVIKLLSNNHDSFYYYLPLLRTYVCNSLFLLSANASAFALCFFIASFGLSSRNVYTLFSLVSAIIYSIIIANAYVITNLALVSSTFSPSSGGYTTTILKACLLLRGRASTALALALPTNLGLAGVEALFQWRSVMLEQAILNIYESMRSELSQIYSNITDLEMQVSEHSLVVNAIQPLDQSRKCFRMIGGVLVERTIKEVLPAVHRNKEGLEEVVRKLYETLEKKKKDMTEFEGKYKIRLRKQDESKEEGGSNKKEGNAQGVLVGAASTS